MSRSKGSMSQGTTSKDTRGSEEAAVELSRTVRLAVQAFDGRQLSDNELDVLCDAALIGPVDRDEEDAPWRANA